MNCFKKPVPMAIVIASFAILTPLAVLGANLLSKGIDYYKKGEFLRARRYFQIIVRQRPAYWPAHLELANTYMQMKEPRLARGEYAQVVRLRPDARTLQSSQRMIRFIDETIRHTEDGPRLKHEVLTDTGQPAHQGEELKHRINVIKPTVPGHPPVRQATVNTVRRILETLPPSIYKILNEGGATVNLAPNMTDKWPDTLKNEDANMMYLAQAYARCYGKDIYVYEAPLIKGPAHRLGTPFDQEGIKNVLYHELGHAVDDCLGDPSKSRECIENHRQDMAVMPPAMQQTLWYYTKPGDKGNGPSETFAELFASFFGVNGEHTNQVAQYFPRTRQWEKEKLKM